MNVMYNLKNIIRLLDTGNFLKKEHYYKIIKMYIIMQTIKIMEIYKRVYKAIKYKDMNL